MLTILSVFGTRPEAIKLAPVIRELQRRSAGHPPVDGGTEGGGPFGGVYPEERRAQGRLRSLVCVTAQHRQMLDQVLRLFDIMPDYPSTSSGQAT